MKVAVFTSNQPRHVALIESLAEVADEVYAVQECTTLFPGEVADFFRRSAVMQRYFQQVMAAEERVFGGHRFTPPNVRQMAMKSDDLNRVDPLALRPALEADYIIVFGASFIKAPLIDGLIERGAVNIHMGVSPYYRGSSCNFWAAFDGRLDLVGATIHRLSRGLDSGEMLFHALPPTRAWAPFELGMQAVKSAHQGLVAHIVKGDLLSLPAVAQERARELRYTRNADFTDVVAEAYLNALPAAEAVGRAMANRDAGLFLNPFTGAAA